MLRRCCVECGPLETPAPTICRAAAKDHKSFLAAAYKCSPLAAQPLWSLLKTCRRHVFNSDVDKNTPQSANVRGVSRKPRALQRSANLLAKNPQIFR